MDTEEIFKRLERFNANWPKLPKNKIWETGTQYPGEVAVWLAVEIGPYRLIEATIVGKRGGFSEQTTLVDTSQEIPLDQMRIDEVLRLAMEHHFLDLTTMRRQVRRNRLVPLDVARSSMEELRVAIERSPEHYEILFRHELPSPGSSVPTLEGGLPSLGAGAR